MATSIPSTHMAAIIALAKDVLQKDPDCWQCIGIATKLNDAIAGPGQLDLLAWHENFNAARAHLQRVHHATAPPVRLLD